MIDNLKEAIEHAKEVAENWKSQLVNCVSEEGRNKCLECVAEHEKIAEWLTELKERREADRWIPVSERLPDDLEPVNITWINHEPAPYYKEIKDKPFTATGVYFNGQWYWWSTTCEDILAAFSHNYDDIIDKDIEITAWKPLPEEYKEENT